MAQTTAKTQVKQLSTLKGTKLLKRKEHWIVVTLLALLITWVLFVQIPRLIAIHQQQQRFNDIRKIQQAYKTNVQNALGSSLTDMKEYDSCYHLVQHEFHLFGANGVLYCGMNLQGAANPLPDADPANAARDTIARIAKSAMAALQQSGYPYSRSGFGSGPQSDGIANYSDYYTVTIQRQPVVCKFDATNQTASIPTTNTIVTVKPKQIYFSFDCSQPAAKNFFSFIPSSLDKY